MKIKIFKPVLFILITLTSCSLFQGETDSIIDLLPRDTDVPGWVRTELISQYKGKSIKTYNREYDGLGIEKLSFCIYKSLDNPDIEIKLEVIKFKTVLDAYSFYSIKRGPGLFDISDTNEYYTNTAAIVQTGEYIIYAMTEKIDSLLKSELKTFVNIPVMYIGKNYMRGILPAKLNILRSPDGYGILYSRKPYHRFPLIKNIYFTQWIWNNKIIYVFLSETGSFYDAYQLFNRSTESGYVITSSNNVYTAFNKEPDDTYSFISVNDRWIFGCWSLTDAGEGRKILGEILSKIQDYKKISLNMNIQKFFLLNDTRVTS